ncbi:MAG: rod shape-determining protein MreC [Thermodesulfovibrionia bacterium]
MLFKKKSSFFLFFIFLIFALLTYQSIKGWSRISDFPSYPLKILEQGSSAFIKTVKNFFNTYIIIIGKEDENRRLIEQIKKTEQERNQYLEAQHENRRLRDLLELKSQRAAYVTTAEVFAGDPTNWFRILWINKGMDDGISRDMVAVTPLGVVGRIHKVLKNRANIILMTDINSSVAVRIQSSRTGGVLEGRGNDKCYLKYVRQEEDVSVGEKIITSGLDGIYPEGLQVGHITAVKKKDGELFYEIEVATSQNLNAVEEVAILRR